MLSVYRVSAAPLRLAGVRRLIGVASAQQYGNVATVASIPTPDAQTAPDTEPPITIPWSSAAVNNVRLTGVVLREVSLRHLAQLPGQAVASTALALRPPQAPPPSSPQTGQGAGSISVEGFGYTAYQMAQHLRRGQQVQLEGHLKRDRWTDRETGAPRYTHKLVIESLAFIESSPVAYAGSEAAAAQGATAAAADEAYASSSAAEPAPAVSAAAAPAAASASGASGPAAQGDGVDGAQRLRKPGSVHSTPSSARSHEMYQRGMSFNEIAAERNIKPSTVLTHVLNEAALGKPLDWARAANELQIGPAGSPWLTCMELGQAVVAVAQEMQLPVLELPLGAVRQELLNNVVAGAKLAALELHSADLTTTYGAIRFGVALVAQRLDPTDLVQHMPSPLQAVTSLTAQAPHSMSDPGAPC